MSRDDDIRLRHMVDAAREASSFAAGRTREDLDADRQLVMALVKEIEIGRGACALRRSPRPSDRPEPPPGAGTHRVRVGGVRARGSRGDLSGR